MKITVSKDDQGLGVFAAQAIAEKLNLAIADWGRARMILSTGASQFETLGELIKQNVDWSKVTMFHLDEYIGLPEAHGASFRRYLKERFLSKVTLAETVFVDGEGPLEQTLQDLTRKIREAPVDVAVVGIGENAHIAFNDPPADFNTREAYIVVTLDEACRRQQVGEGWFESPDSVPKQAITMTPHQIMASRCIISPVPRAVKADAIAAMLRAEYTDPAVPATLLKTHPDFHLFLDSFSASKCTQDVLAAGV